jgi:hypothetical protein
MTERRGINLFDKRGIPFERGDVVKVFHFTGARRKRYYMYHQCIGVQNLGLASTPYAAFSHLNFIEDRSVQDGPYVERLDGRRLADYEIVQSIKCDHEERDRAIGEIVSTEKPDAG